MISDLAVMGIRDDDGWVEVTEYTPIYSAVVKVARMLVVRQSWLERQAEMAALVAEQGLDEEDARAKAEGMFTIVQAKVQRFMMRTSERKMELRPMDWIYDARTYGMHARFNPTAGGSIDWDGEQVTHRRTKFSMGQLSEMLHVDSIVGHGGAGRHRRAAPDQLAQQ